MRPRLLLLAAALPLAAACAGNKDVRLTSEPSIERAMDLLDKTPEGSRLLKFLYKHPVDIEYSNTAGICHKFSLAQGEIYLPPEYRASDPVLALAVGRAAYIYRIYAETGLEQLISEEEELSALAQGRLAVELKVRSSDFDKVKEAAGIKADICAYLLGGSGYAMEQARKEALAPDKDCQRPLDTLESRRIWLDRIREAMDNDTFYQLLYERDLLRVHNGSMTMAEAMKNDATLRGMPTYDVYRYERSFYDDQSDIFSKMAGLRKDDLEKEAAWRKAMAAEIDQEREEFSSCALPQ
jgi:hypothetical protein